MGYVSLPICKQTLKLVMCEWNTAQIAAKSNSLFYKSVNQ